MMADSPFIGRAEAVQILTTAGYTPSSISGLLCGPLRSQRWPGTDHVIDAVALIESIKRLADAAGLPPYRVRRLVAPFRERVLDTRTDIDIHINNLIAKGMIDAELRILRTAIERAEWHSRPVAIKPGGQTWTRAAVLAQAQQYREKRRC